MFYPRKFLLKVKTRSIHLNRKPVILQDPKIQVHYLVSADVWKEKKLFLSLQNRSHVGDRCSPNGLPVLEDFAHVQHGRWSCPKGHTRAWSPNVLRQQTREGQIYFGSPQIIPSRCVPYYQRGVSGILIMCDPSTTAATIQSSPELWKQQEQKQMLHAAGQVEPRTDHNQGPRVSPTNQRNHNQPKTIHTWSIRCPTCVSTNRTTEKRGFYGHEQEMGQSPYTKSIMS
jgi:hypothetical protein